jgi:hypothetical protein
MIGPLRAERREEAQGGERGALPRSPAQRRCKACSLPVEARAPSCLECGGEALLTRSGAALASQIVRQKQGHAWRHPRDEAPLVRCAFCLRQIEAAQAYHRRYDGQAVCWGCKQAEEAQA